MKSENMKFCIKDAVQKTVLNAGVCFKVKTDSEEITTIEAISGCKDWKIS